MTIFFTWYCCSVFLLLLVLHQLFNQHFNSFHSYGTTTTLILKQSVRYHIKKKQTTFQNGMYIRTPLPYEDICVHEELMKNS